MEEQNFNLYSRYYNLLYTDKDYKAEVDYLAATLRKYSTAPVSILEFGSGTGRHGLLLNQKGFSVFGVERSEGMTRVAKASGFSCANADIASYKSESKYDAVISLFHVVSYLTDNENLIQTFQNAHHHLKEDGIFLFDVWYSPAVYVQKAEPRIKRMQNDELNVIRFAEPKSHFNSNVINVQFTLLVKELQSEKFTELVENHPMRHFSIPEIELLARLTGFKVIRSEEFMTGKEPSENTWGVCFVLKKV